MPSCVRSSLPFAVATPRRPHPHGGRADTSYNRPRVTVPMNGAPDGPPDGRVLRLLDANANRAREALRVVEDYARFVLDDAGLSEELKGLRHELATATRSFVGEAI